MCWWPARPPPVFRPSSGVTRNRTVTDCRAAGVRGRESRDRAGRTALLLLALLPGLPLAESAEAGVHPAAHRDTRSGGPGGQGTASPLAGRGRRSPSTPPPMAVPAPDVGPRPRPTPAGSGSARRRLRPGAQTRPGAPAPGGSLALPLTEDQVALLERSHSDAGAVWFREMADDTLHLFNQGYLGATVCGAPIWRGVPGRPCRP